MTDEAPRRPTLDDHPGLDNGEATNEGKMMTAAGSTGADGHSAKPRKDDHA